MSEIYDYIITKPPLDEDTLAHYGIKGMKWHVRKAIGNIKGKLTSKRRNRKYVASHLADDIESGKRKRVTNDYPYQTNKRITVSKNGKEVWSRDKVAGYDRATTTKELINELNKRNAINNRRQTLQEYNNARYAENMLRIEAAHKKKKR